MQNPGKVNNSKYREKEIMEGNKNLTQVFHNQLGINSIVFFLFFSLSMHLNQKTFAQVQFATLKGSPIDTSGWKMKGVSFLGTTSGTNAVKSEVILCDKRSIFSFGSIYYKKPLKINETCNQWTVNFEFRINDGTTADGLSFFYVDKPENATDDGSVLGIPMSVNGIAVAIDTYENCCAQGFNCPNNNNPELQLRKLSSIKNYFECDTLPGTQISNLTYLRSKDYQKMTVVFKNDSIFVSIRDNLLLKYPVTLNLSGYFGFSAANGGSFDTHSIRNVEINIPRDTLRVDAGRDTSICAGVEIPLGSDSISGYSYSWESSPSSNLNSITAAKPKFKSNTAGIYQLTLRTDSTKAKCFSTDVVTINVKPNPSFLLSPHDTLLCKGQTATLPKIFKFLSTTTTNQTISWSPKTFIDTSNNITPKFYPNTSTTYKVKVKNTLTNCFTTDSIKIKIDSLPLPIVNLGKDTSICENQLLILNSNPNTTNSVLLWNTGDLTQTINVNNPGTYWVSSKNNNGCSGKSDTIIVKACPPTLLQIPNVFTPNNDSKNDYFFIQSQNLDKFQLNIFNRWGETVFSSSDKFTKWEAKNVPDGIYFYHLTFNGLDEYSQSQEKKGTIQLIR